MHEKANFIFNILRYKSLCQLGPMTRDGTGQHFQDHSGSQSIFDFTPYCISARILAKPNIYVSRSLDHFTLDLT